MWLQAHLYQRVGAAMLTGERFQEVSCAGLGMHGTGWVAQGGWHRMAQHGTGWRGMAQQAVAWHGVTQHGTAGHSTAAS